MVNNVSKDDQPKMTFLTDDSEVQGGLSEAVAVPQLHGVAAAVLLLPAGDGEFTAAVVASYGDPT